MREYLEEMGENLTSADISAHTGNTIADAIIAEKTAKAQSLGLSLDCSGKITDIEISPVDMCKMLANLLDNAIEAASVPELSEMDGSLRVIKLLFKKTENFFMITVSNPCIKAPQIKDGKESSCLPSKTFSFILLRLSSLYVYRCLYRRTELGAILESKNAHMFQSIH